MAIGTNCLESLMEGVKVGCFQLAVREAEKVVHDQIASQSGKRITQIQKFFTLSELSNSAAQSLQMAMKNGLKTEYRPSGKPAAMSVA